ncbi:uncharacterized protein LOC132035491 [Lycium ferocissimum]|uniref:uncharacterized protein LOC132035491 n=1 Tax=Lycium ferocissimum TaxID=112874 RepID=UPI002816088F|nr:uncharacterized protein LOC132035491 [Lycium ferocissimum]
MHATVQRSTQVEVPTDNEFDFGGTTYLPSLNIDFSRGIVQQQTIVGFGSQSNDTTNYGTQYDGVASTHYHNSDWSRQNRETGGPSNATTQFHNLNCNVRHPSHPGPSELDSDRHNDFEDNPTLTQLTQIVSNNDLANDIINESDSDSPLDHEGMDNDQSSADGDDSDEDVAASGDLSVNYHSNVIPYLDNTEEVEPEDFAYMRDNESVRAAL